MSESDGINVRLRAFIIGFAQATSSVAWDTEGTYMVVEPRKDQIRGWTDGIAAIEAARKQELARLAVEISGAKEQK